MKILVVDDHALVREGLSLVLKGLDEQVEVLEAANCAHAFDLARRHPDIDLVLLDHGLPDMNGLEALAIFEKKHPELPIVMLAGMAPPKLVRQVLERGAAGFLTKSGMCDELLMALRQVLAGEVYVQSDLQMAQDMNQESGSGPESLAPQLTRRQEEVLHLLLEGRSNKDISQMLQLADETTKCHVAGVLRAFGVQNRIQAVLAAARHGYIKLDSSV